MAIERRRGCGYRKLGGLYLVCDSAGARCGRLPIPLTVCPTCSHGIKPARGWTWITPAAIIAAGSPLCREPVEYCLACPLVRAEDTKRAGLIWVGERFYSSPRSFQVEAEDMGISRRIARVPRGFKVGVTWVFLAHVRAVPEPAGEGLPGIFSAFLPQRVELLITTTEATPARLDELADNGITPVIVPDGDRDHMGSVYDDRHEQDSLFSEEQNGVTNGHSA